MEATRRGQVRRSAAHVYDEFFVPALFGEWSAPMADVLALKPGERVLDVACGTGTFAREAARRVGPENVVGVDRNEGMLEVARQRAPDVAWRDGLAESLPFEDGAFDAVACQFALMFFDDRRRALSEMWRVLKPGGRLAAATWASLDDTPGYAAMVALLKRLFGEPVADALRAPFVLGDRDEVVALFEAAGIPGATAQTRIGTARFPSIHDWVHTDVKGWTLADLIDDAQFETLKREAAKELARFETDGGAVRFDSPAHIVTATRS